MSKLRAISFANDRVQFFVNHDGSTHKVVVPRTLLEDLSRTNFNSIDEVARSFERHRTLIEDRTAAALEAGRRGDGTGAVVLGLLDFPEA